MSSAANSPAPTQNSPLQSVHTDSFAALLEQSSRSVAVTTYQAGFIVLLRFDGTAVNTHFRNVPRPMGMAVSASHLAVGAARELVQYENNTAVCSKIEGPQPHDACYLPRKVHVTGDIDIHEMAFGETNNAWSGASGLLSSLWIVNTRFSCLCTLNEEHSFVPQWRPPFVSGLSPQDRCHLNGLALVNGRPRYVTALGESDAPAGWRENKANGGVLIDVDSDETIVRGLSMPHSPRWYDGQLWVLESGDGSIGTVDLATGRYNPAAKVDGFARGLDFVGPYALVGISQVRESAIFSGIPITERLAPESRICGVSLIDLRLGREVRFLRFEANVQEIFAVQVLPHRFPEMLEMSNDLLGNTYALPDEALAEVNWLPNQQDDKLGNSDADQEGTPC